MDNQLKKFNEQFQSTALKVATAANNCLVDSLPKDAGVTRKNAAIICISVCNVGGDCLVNFGLPEGMPRDLVVTLLKEALKDMEHFPEGLIQFDD